MESNYNLVTVNSRYCDYLRNYDDRVSYNAQQKDLRPFVGVLFQINEYQYFAPLSSPKAKHLRMKNTMDFYKINGGKLGAINFNNMIPVPNGEYKPIDMNATCKTKKEKMYQELLKDQLRWLNRYGKNLKHKAKELYLKRIQNKLPENMVRRCCDFVVLEEKCREYIKLKRKG